MYNYVAYCELMLTFETSVVTLKTKLPALYELRDYCLAVLHNAYRKDRADTYDMVD
jgi:hypothetical protein